MSKLLAVAIGLGLSAGVAQAQPAYDNDQTEDYTPSTPPPNTTPPPPSYGSVVPAGQWIYTAQYGWVWMPVSQQYLNGDYAYVYQPSSGWVWLSAPWVFEVGPRPYYWYGYGHRHYYQHWYPRYRPSYRFHGERFRPDRHFRAPHEVYRTYPQHVRRDRDRREFRGNRGGEHRPVQTTRGGEHRRGGDRHRG